jgi:hypothetical protein
MSEIALTIFLVVLTFVVSVVGYRLYAGFYPGSKVIIETPPAERNGLDSDHARIMFFYATWCPWSTKARKSWDSFKQTVQNTHSTFGGKTIIFEEVDVEADKGKAALYNIKEYPTIKAETQTSLFLFRGHTSPKAFEEFSIEALGKIHVG